MIIPGTRRLGRAQMLFIICVSILASVLGLGYGDEPGVEVSATSFDYSNVCRESGATPTFGFKKGAKYRIELCETFYKNNPGGSVVRVHLLAQKPKTEIALDTLGAIRAKTKDGNEMEAIGIGYMVQIDRDGLWRYYFITAIEVPALNIVIKSKKGANLLVVFPASVGPGDSLIFSSLPPVVIE